MPPKRKASKKEADTKAPAKQAKQDGQKAISHDLDVPLDEGFHEDCESGIAFDSSHGCLIFNRRIMKKTVSFLLVSDTDFA